MHTARIHFHMDGKKRIEGIVGSLLHYARAVDLTLLKGLNTISRKQAAPTKLTEKWAEQILGYVAAKPDGTVRYKASGMILKVHFDTSYLNGDRARSSYGGYFFLGCGWKQSDDEPLKLNGCMSDAVGLLKLVAASAAESELGGLFCNVQDTTTMQLMLTEMGFPQPTTKPMSITRQQGGGNFSFFLTNRLVLSDGSDSSRIRVYVSK